MLVHVLFVVMLLCIPIDKVPTHVNLDVTGILFHPMIEPSMVQRWLQVLNLCFNLLRLRLVKQGEHYHVH